MATSKGKALLEKGGYVERDVSWMFFNYRIIKEAEREDVPLYERLSFLGIYSNNLDEFYKVRVASLKRIAASKASGIKGEVKTAKDTVDRIVELTEEYSREYNKVLKHVFAELAAKGICLIDENQMDEEQKAFAHDFFMREVSGYINPIILTKNADLSEVNDSHIYLAVKMTAKGKNPAYALVSLPVASIGRFVRLPDGKDHKAYIIYIDDIVRFHLPYIFNEMGYEHFDAYAFKFSKDAKMQVESDPEEGVLKTISEAVRERRKGMPVRAIFGEGVPEDLKKDLIKRLDVDDLDLVTVGGRYHNNKDLMDFPYVPGKGLRYEPWPSIEIPEVQKGISLIDRIRKKDLLIHVPYESFDSFIRFLQECAISPRVKEIKATIYRAANNSKVVKALVAAAQNGKKVTCMVELMARFNESSNILISQMLRDAGCEVLTGAEGFKVHGKIVFVKVKDGPDIAVISSGNFHEGNAKTYTDCLLFTADRKIVKEIDSIFTMIARPYAPVRFNNLLVSPLKMESVFQRLIRKEEQNHKKGLPSGIKIKINHITDKPMVSLLYEASAAGVPIKLLVRGNCSLKTGVRGISDNIEIHAIIDRYLEHSRIFIFENGGTPLYFMGSADWMPRNLYNRIEVIAPIYDPDIQKELETIVDYGMADNQKAALVDGSGKYLPILPNGKKPFRSQEELYDYYLEKDDKELAELERKELKK